MMQITFEIDGARAEGTIAGKPFVVSRQGMETSISIDGHKHGENTFGALIASNLLEFCDTLMDGINVVIDETDDLEVWAELNETLAAEVYDALM